MKRYALFVGSEYYPHGGWKDLRALYDTLEEATAAATAAMRDEIFADWFHVVDLQADMKPVLSADHVRYPGGDEYVANQRDDGGYDESK